ncbi:MAG TPA: hypothetical protein VHG71_00140 [Verrucomicrobiae bacterium]|nr:hypothetical protein [Verrucomicrobiae bacterium]
MKNKLFLIGVLGVLQSGCVGTYVPPPKPEPVVSLSAFNGKTVSIVPQFDPCIGKGSYQSDSHFGVYVGGSWNETQSNRFLLRVQVIGTYVIMTSARLRLGDDIIDLVPVGITDMSIGNAETCTQDFAAPLAVLKQMIQSPCWLQVITPTGTIEGSICQDEDAMDGLKKLWTVVSQQ